MGSIQKSGALMSLFCFILDTECILREERAEERQSGEAGGR